MWQGVKLVPQPQQDDRVRTGQQFVRLGPRRIFMMTSQESRTCKTGEYIANTRIHTRIHMKLFQQIMVMYSRWHLDYKMRGN